MTDDAPNLRRRIVGLERQLSASWRLYVVGWLCLTGAAAFCGVSVLVWAATVAMWRGF